MTEIISELNGVVLSFLLVMPRFLVIFIYVPTLSFSQLPKTLRAAIVVGIVSITVPVTSQMISAQDITYLNYIFLLIKEVALGMIIGFVLALPFWIFQSTGALVDNQRGALSAGYLNPASGPDASMLGDLLGKVFILYVIEIGMHTILIGIILQSYSIWPPWEWLPALDETGMMHLVHLFHLIPVKFMLYAGPIVLVLLLIETAFAIMGAYSPQMQVYFMAMPAKSLIALVVLFIYLTYFEVIADDELNYLLSVMDHLHKIVVFDK